MNPKMQRDMALAAANRSPRCLAHNRKGFPCRRPATRGLNRCHLHGGALGSGAPKGNRNRWVHGRYSRGSQRLSARICDLLKAARLLAE